MFQGHFYIDPARGPFAPCSVLALAIVLSQDFDNLHILKGVARHKVMQTIFSLRDLDFERDMLFHDFKVSSHSSFLLSPDSPGPYQVLLCEDQAA